MMILLQSMPKMRACCQIGDADPISQRYGRDHGGGADNEPQIAR